MQPITIILHLERSVCTGGMPGDDQSMGDIRGYRRAEMKSRKK
jgi:hypothetical protein